MNRNSAVSISGNAITPERIRMIAPSVFAEHPQQDVSDRYSFIPTYKVMEALLDDGWFVTRAQQSMVRLIGNKMFAQHMLRFRRQEAKLVVGDVFPEIGLTNSHNRMSAYSMFAGFFRLACLNGMVVASGELAQIRIRHSGNVIDDVQQGATAISQSMPALVEDIKEMQSVNLSNDEQVGFAKAAVALRYDDEHPIAKDPVMLLQPKRYGDAKSDLWNTFNVVQENLTKGGVRYVHPSYRDEEGKYHISTRQRTREINSIHEDTKLNKALWVLAEEMKKLKAA